MKTKTLALLLPVCILAACSEVKETVGLGRNAPDEFSVVERAPLTLPPNFELRTPDPGALRPQESNVREKAERIVTRSAEGGNTATTTSGTNALLGKAGAVGADPNIRRTIDQESAGIMRRDPGFVDRLIFWDGQKPPDPQVDPKKEKKRLEKNSQEGLPANEGDVPVIDKKRKAPLESLF